MSDPNIGRLLNKRYQLQELIGTGAMGRVYCAKDILLGGVPVAVKFLALSIQNEKMRLQERFEREAKTCALLGQKSLHIVRVMDYGVDEKDTPYYVMEYLQGHGLNTVIRKQHVTVSRFLSMSRQICLGLQCAHDGILIDGVICPIIHRDIKPSNMWVVQDPSFGELVKVLDFGIAKLLMSDGDQTKFYLGTLAYSSPEQMEGKELDNRSDIYSLGVLMFEMLTGKMPFIASAQSFGAWYKVHHFQPPHSFAEVAPKVTAPKALEDLIMGCLAKTPGERPQKIAEILSALATIESEQDNTDNSKNKYYYTTEPLAKDKITAQPTPNHKIENLTHPLSEGKTGTNLPFPMNVDEIINFVVWPANKPIADIVFPQPLHHNRRVAPTLWVMLSQAEIMKRLHCTRYNQFLFISSPHPMLLWITVIYNRKHGPKWLHYYLDLKSSFGQEMVRLLQHSGSYYILLFAREYPNRCAHILNSSIATNQCQRLREWLQASNITRVSADPQVSKDLLKREYEKIKSKIVAKLETIDTDSPFDLSG